MTEEIFDPKKHYRCAVCKEVFEKIIDETWDDNKAAEEMKQVFNKEVDDCDLVCEDCYKEIMRMN